MTAPKLTTSQLPRLFDPSKVTIWAHDVVSRITDQFTAIVALVNPMSDSVITNTTDIATNTTDIATNTAAIAALAIYGKFAVHRNGTNQTGLTGGAFNKIQFTTEAFDTDNIFDSTTNYRYQPTKAGYYFIGLRINAVATATDQPEAAIYLNGAIVAAGTYSNASATGAFSQASDFVFLNGSSDYIEGYVYLPATITVLSGAVTSTRMFGWRVGP